MNPFVQKILLCTEGIWLNQPVELVVSGPDVALERLRRKLWKNLEGYSAEGAKSLDPWSMEAPLEGPVDDLPVPELVLFLLHRFLRFPMLDIPDKCRWSVGCMVAGKPVVFRDRKRGFEILVAKDSGLTWNRIVRPLKGAIRVLENEFLNPMADMQIKRGNVTIPNRFVEFRDRYRHFRKAADDAFHEAIAKTLEPGGCLPGSLDGLAEYFNRGTRAKRRGFFHSTAMVDAYFSFLEHRLILLRAFTGVPLVPGEFERLVKARWDGKLSNVIKLTSTAKGQELLRQMRRIKEKVRNPFAHGGVENDGSSIMVHLDSFGALPSNFSRYKDSVRFKHLPIGPEDHAEMSLVFDDLDALMETESLAGPHRFIEGCVDPAYDPGASAEYAEALAGGLDAIDAYVEAWNDMWERHQNADY